VFFYFLVAAEGGDVSSVANKSPAARNTSRWKNEKRSLRTH